VGALLVGVQAAKGLAWGRGLPLVGVDHLVGHLLAVFLRRGASGAGTSGAGTSGAGASDAEAPPVFPFVALLASGGHTAIYRVDGPTASAVRELGATRDDAAGEAFDKVAKLLGLPYPGGPAIDRLARSGDPKAVRLTLPMGHDRSFDLSFSGIKTQVAARVRERGAPASPEELADTCASFQAAVTSVLAKKLVAAAVAEGVRTVVIGGGVAANSELRARVTKLAGEHGLRAVLPELASCTDNAAMIAYAGLVRLRAGERDGWDLVATSATSLPRTTRKGRGAR
jgi:N6-L-threonylcarbamoyladenine synthase